MSAARMTRPLRCSRSRFLLCVLVCDVVGGVPAFSMAVEPAGGPEVLPEGPVPVRTDPIL